MSMEQLTIVFRFGTLNVEFALDEIVKVLSARHVPLAGFELSRAALNSVQDAVRILRESGRKVFHLVGPLFEFHLTSIRNFQVDVLEIRARAPEVSWDEWARHFVASSDFVMAWIANSDYQYWQNAHDRLQYTAVGRAYDHLPRVSNGLPYPLEQEIIDTSRNPGRRILRKGFIEAIGSVMWLGESFWKVTRVDQSRIAEANWLASSPVTSTVTRLQSAEHCFDDQSDIDTQVKLRALLFGAD